MVLTREMRVVVGLGLIGSMELLRLFIKRLPPRRLRGISPWAGPLVLSIWVAGLLVFLWKGWASLAAGWVIGHFNVTFYRWIKARSEFEDPERPEDKEIASLIRLRGRTYIGVNDPAFCETWYAERLGLRRLAERLGPDRKIVKLKFGEKDTGYVVLGPPYQFSLLPRAVLFSRKLARVRDVFGARGIDVGAIQVDRQGTSFFEFRDPAGNTIEVCDNR